MTGVNWRRLLEGLDADAPAVHDLVDATDTSVSAAYDRVEAALNAGDLLEVDAGPVPSPERRPDP